MILTKREYKLPILPVASVVMVEEVMQSAQSVCVFMCL